MVAEGKEDYHAAEAHSPTVSLVFSYSPPPLSLPFHECSTPGQRSYQYITVGYRWTPSTKMECIRR
eukprot:747684-Hanusia_phi.AAC.5